MLLPAEISEAGYRLYGTKELERLQHILLYRELEFPLEQIKQLLKGEGDRDRIAILAEQEQLLKERKQRLDTILTTLRTSIDSVEKGEPMEARDMFTGFESEEAWREALKEQDEHLQATYGVDAISAAPIDVPEMNEMAAEAVAFMHGMAEALREGVKHQDARIASHIEQHLAFLNKHGHAITLKDFAAQARFFVEDDFHRQMLEGQQTGLAYYLLAAAESLVATQ